HRAGPVWLRPPPHRRRARPRLRSCCRLPCARHRARGRGATGRRSRAALPAASTACGSLPQPPAQWQDRYVQPPMDLLRGALRPPAAVISECAAAEKVECASPPVTKTTRFAEIGSLSFAPIRLGRARAVPPLVP